jgi:hypothetical protein
MKITSHVTIAILLAVPAVGMQQQLPHPKDVPKIPVETIKQFWQVDDAQRAARQALKDAQAAAQVVNTDWQDPYCGVKTGAPAPAGK